MIGYSGNILHIDLTGHSQADQCDNRLETFGRHAAILVDARGAERGSLSRIFCQRSRARTPLASSHAPARPSPSTTTPDSRTLRCPESVSRKNPLCGIPSSITRDNRQSQIVGQARIDTVRIAGVEFRTIHDPCREAENGRHQSGRRTQGGLTDHASIYMLVINN